MTILATIIVLGVLIFVHELGHFAAAKAVGVEVQRFSIGLGPRVLGFQKGETEYVLSAIPLGGYVKMGGMDDEVMDRLEGGSKEPRQPSSRDFDSKPIWARTIVISAGVIMNMLFAFGTFTFVAARWGLPELQTTQVGLIEADLLPPGTEDLASVAVGARITRIGELDIEDWGDVQEGLYESAPGPLRLETVDPAQTVEIRIPADEDDRLDLVRAVHSWLDARVGPVNPGSPADKAGVEEGDQVLAVDGVEVATWYEFVDEIEARPGRRSELTLIRDGRQVIRAVELDAVEQTRADGSVIEVGRVGVFPPDSDYSFEQVSMTEAVAAGYRQTERVTLMILGLL
jgi:regulator of sigma E protease